MAKLTLAWFKAALIRAIKTVAQTATGMIGVGAAFGDIDWIYVLSVSLVSGLVSVLTSLAGLPEVDLSGEYIVMDSEGNGDIAFDFAPSLKDGKVIRLKVKNQPNK